MVIPIRVFDGFEFIIWCRFYTVPAYFTAILTIGFPIVIVHAVIFAPAAATDAAPEFLTKTARANLHGFTIHICGIRKFCGCKTLMTAAAARKISIPAFFAHQMSVKFNSLVLSHVFTAMRTDKVTLARAPDTHGFGPGVNDILTGKIPAAALAFFVCFMGAIPAYMDLAPLDKIRFPLYIPMTTSAFAHNIISRIISIRLSVSRHITYTRS